jgi:hypothetical protein
LHHVPRRHGRALRTPLLQLPSGWVEQSQSSVDSAGDTGGSGSNSGTVDSNSGTVDSNSEPDAANSEAIDSNSEPDAANGEPDDPNSEPDDPQSGGYQPGGDPGAASLAPPPVTPMAGSQRQLSRTGPVGHAQSPRGNKPKSATENPNSGGHKPGGDRGRLNSASPAVTPKGGSQQRPLRINNGSPRTLGSRPNRR